MNVDFHIMRCNDTFAVVVFDSIYATTTCYDEIESIIGEWCECHGVDLSDANAIEH